GTDNVIGGTTAAAGNTIGFNQTGITLDASVTQNTIRLNSIFCNTTAGITLTGAANSSMPVPVIVTPDVSSIFGTAQAGATIDLYLHDTAGCPGAPCQGRTFLGTATADGIGNWVIPGSFGSGGEVTAVATDVNGNSSEFGVCQTVNVLLAPIDITLQASAEGPFTQLRWTISSQEENGTFVIEKAAEGETFTSVANLPLQSEQVQYQFQDAANQNQRLRYRVSLQLPDGHVYQSNQVELTGQGVQSLLVYPNPATTQLDLLLPEAAAWQVQLFNHAGQTVLQQGFSQSAHSLQVDQLPRGMYLIQATATNGDRFQTKVLLQ
ncbi:MAG: T9SS type A sorting domain-containing protein, partial [Bacteroidota bacterium]